MPNLKEVKNRINSVISTQQITKAMKMVAAAKLRRAQDSIIQMRPYAQKLGDVLENVSGGLEAGQSTFSAQKDENRNYDGKDLQGMSGNLAFKFGAF